jgi:hypothetical protein
MPSALVKNCISRLGGGLWFAIILDKALGSNQSNTNHNVLSKLSGHQCFTASRTDNDYSELRPQFAQPKRDMSDETTWQPSLAYWHEARPRLRIRFRPEGQPCSDSISPLAMTQIS